MTFVSNKKENMKKNMQLQQNKASFAQCYHNLKQA